MIAARRLSTVASKRYVTALQSGTTSTLSSYGRTAAYRRLIESSYRSSSATTSSTSWPTTSPSSPFSNRTIHTSRSLRQQAAKKQEPEEEVRDPPRTEPEESTKTETKSEETKSDEAKSEESASEGEKDSKKEDKKDAPPPPPHGDKTPWQVFTETLRTEFKASKEWNESTKKLQGEVQEFRESERVKKAGAAYEATVGRGSRAAGQALKGTAKAVGEGAAWTWNTTGVQAVRKGVNAAGRGVEQATRPIRETKTFKDIQEAVDDGNSSRYGGWIEKEERRKRRELRDAKDGTKRVEKMEEDPKYVSRG